MENDDQALITLADIVRRLETAGLDYMLTGSMALNCYTQPRMTRDLDFVLAFYLKDLPVWEEALGTDYYFSPEAARGAIHYQSSFNVIHLATMFKVDFMIRKREDYRLVEFERRCRSSIRGIELWVVSREDLILSKLDWARDSQSQRQLNDVENLLASDCDWDYLRKWSANLNLTDMLTRASP